MPLPSLSPGVLPDDWKNGGFGLDVHWPFCVSKCPYCDFNSHVAGTVDQEIWRSAFLRALEHYAREVDGRRLRSIYFGGGTPSLMQPDLVGAIIDAAQQHWVFDNAIEITLEANPNSVEAARFQGYHGAGVNRISLGVQALDDSDLRKLGRMHSAKEALAALEIAGDTFERVSFDLIYARQDQSLEDWQGELEFALSLGPEHLSLYQLSVEPGTVFGARAKAGKLPGLPGDDLAADMYELTQNLCNTNGLQQYEVSNHAREGRVSVHNMIYWQAGDYVGIGPGAHGRLTLDAGRFATETPLSPEAWLNATHTGPGESLRTLLDGAEQATEYLLMGLRTRSGISLTRLADMGETHLDPKRINQLAELGLVENTGDALRVTAQGMPLLNAILRELAP